MIEFKIVRLSHSVVIGVLEEGVITQVAYMDPSYGDMEKRVAMARVLVEGANQAQIEAVEKVAESGETMSAFQRYQQGIVPETQLKKALRERGVISSSAGRRPPVPAASEEEWAAFEEADKIDNDILDQEVQEKRN